MDLILPKRIAKAACRSGLILAGELVRLLFLSPRSPRSFQRGVAASSLKGPLENPSRSFTWRASRSGKEIKTVSDPDHGGYQELTFYRKAGGRTCRLASPILTLPKIAHLDGSLSPTEYGR